MITREKTPFPLYCVIPAAGRSSRMGEWKPLMPWHGTTICGAVVDTAIAAGLRPVVVAGYRAVDLSAAFACRTDVALVVNESWERGMLGSIRTGVEAIGRLSRERGEDGFAGFFVAPADMPRIPARAFGLIASRIRTTDAGGKPEALFASRDGRLGHPVWIPSAFVPGLADLDPGSRLRDYLMGRPWACVDIDDDGIFADIDTREAYEASMRACT